VALSGTSTYTINDGINDPVEGYEQGVYTFGPYPNGLYTIRIQDENNIDCQQNIIGNNTCEGEIICDLAVAGVPECIDDESYNIALTIEGISTYTLSDGINDDITGLTAGEIELGPYSDPNYEITLINEKDETCTESLTGFQDCESGCSLSAIADESCINTSSYFVRVEVNANGPYTAQDGFNTPQTGQTGGTVLMGPFYTENYAITISLDDNPDCSIIVTGSTDCITEPEACIPFTVNNTFECEDEVGGFITIELNGPNTYIIDDGFGTLLGPLESGSYTFGPIPNIDYTFTVTDATNPNCSESVSGSADCLDCTSILSNPEIDQVYVNYGDTLEVFAEFGVFDEGYESGFILFTDRSDPIGSIVSVSMTGSFINSGLDIPSNMTLYVSAAILQVPFGSDYDAACTIISDPFATETFAVFFLDPINIDLVPICDEQDNTVLITVIVSGGLPELIGGEYDVTGTVDTIVTSENQDFIMGPFDQEDEITIEVSDGNGGIASIIELGSEICQFPQAATLVTFSGEVQEPGNLLYWVTASEYKNDYFSVEHSLDGINFKAIGTVKGAGNSNQSIRYDLLDTEAPDGISYYRLLKTDFNGVTDIASRIIALERKTGYFGEISAYPNPTDGPVILDINSNTERDIIVEIYDVTGRLMQAEHFTIYLGRNRLNLSLSRFSAGTYHLTIVSDDSFEMMKVIKQ